jgi:hypothetical protein
MKSNFLCLDRDNIVSFVFLPYRNRLFAASKDLVCVSVTGASGYRGVYIWATRCTSG